MLVSSFWGFAYFAHGLWILNTFWAHFSGVTRNCLELARRLFRLTLVIFLAASAAAWILVEWLFQRDIISTMILFLHYCPIKQQRLDCLMGKRLKIFSGLYWGKNIHYCGFGAVYAFLQELVDSMALGSTELWVQNNTYVCLEFFVTTYTRKKPGGF